MQLETAIRYANFIVIVQEYFIAHCRRRCKVNWVSAVTVHREDLWKNVYYFRGSRYHTIPGPPA